MVDRVGHCINGYPQQGKSRGLGWEFVPRRNRRRLARRLNQVLPEERQESATAFLAAAIACYASLGIAVTPVMTTVVLPFEGLTCA